MNLMRGNLQYLLGYLNNSRNKNTTCADKLTLNVREDSIGLNWYGFISIPVRVNILDGGVRIGTPKTQTGIANSHAWRYDL